MVSADIFGTSTAELATLMNSIMADRNVITEDNLEELIDCSAINRQRRKFRKMSKPSKANISGLYSGL